MSNIQIYKKVFSETLSVKEDKLEKLSYNDIPEWDSIGHMNLVSTIEDEFSIEMDIDDITDISDYYRGKEVLQKYNIIFD